jgi:hypothetical protein
MTVGGAANFHPAKPTAGSSGTPNLRRATFTCCDPLPIGIGFGWPLGHPRATQAWRKGGPSVDLAKCFCLQQKLKKGRVGAWKSPRSPESPTSRVIGKAKALNSTPIWDGLGWHGTPGEGVGGSGDLVSGTSGDRKGSGLRRFRSFDSRLRRSLTMTVCSAANFHPAKPTAVSSGTPILRRAAYD